MKYKITKYDDYHKIVEFQVAENTEDLDKAQVLSISLEQLSDVAELEKLMFQTYVSSLSIIQRGSYSLILEDYVNSSVDTVQDMSIDLPVGSNSIISSRSDAVSEETTSTITRII